MQSADLPPRITPAYAENSRWLMQHLSEIVRQHPNQWVAVRDGRVVAANADLGLVDAAARADNSADTVFHFVDDGSLIFSARSGGFEC